MLICLIISVVPGTKDIVIIHNVMHDCRGNADSSPRTGNENGLTVSWHVF